jgi:hypothetical protein
LETKLNSDGQVYNNLVDATRNANLNVHHQKDVTNEAKHGIPQGDSWAHQWNAQPWNADDGRDDGDVTANTWGAPHGATDFSASTYDKWVGKYFDASWELGDSPMHFGEIDSTNLPINGGTHTGGADPTIYSGYRWFEGIDSNLNGGSSEVNDPAKLKCHTCNVQRELFWTGTQFSLVVPGATSTNKNNENLWAECNASLNQRSCEYSSGTCFVEERRTWGYVTQVRAGCKQAQACYMQKYQNFLVQAGRQCWPGGHADTNHKVASRPYDLMADNWITNIVAGGIADKATGSSFGSSVGYYTAGTFDNTYTNMPGGGMNPAGFFKTGGPIGSSGSSTQFLNRNSPVSNQAGDVSYQNGMMPTSKCYQCCNTEHNCNYQWQPHTESDWEYAYVWRYDTSTFAAGNFAIGLENNPRDNGDGIISG